MAEWTDIEKQRLRNLHAQGLTPAEMVVHFPDRTRNSIIGQLNKLRLRTRNAYLGRGLGGRPEGQTAPDTELIIRLRCKWNWPPKSIAQALGKHPKAVYTILEKYTEGAAA